jgi:hypothetical protein
MIAGRRAGRFDLDYPFASAERRGRFAGRELRFEPQRFAAPGSTVKVFASVITCKPG